MTSVPVRVCVLFTGLLLVLLITTTARSQNIDDLGLYNPIAVWLTTGKWAYPIHGQLDGMSIHPPFRYFEIALLMWAGVSQSVAFGVMPIAFTVLAIAYLYDLEWEPGEKLAACLALLSLYTLMLREGVGIRPDMEMAIAWIAGLLGLCHARERGWPAALTVSATAVLTYASCLHYVGALGILGAGVYVVDVWRQGGFGKALRLARLMALGALVVLGPYAALYIVPQWKEYAFVFSLGASSLGGASPWDVHLQLYLRIASILSHTSNFSPGIITTPLLFGLPPIVVGLLGLLFWPRRQMLFVLSMFPLVLFIMFQSRKWHTYLYAEFFVTVFGLSLFMFGGLRLLLSRLDVSSGARSASAAIAFLALVFFHLDPTIPVRAAMQPSNGILEGEIARAASKSVIGDDRLIAGRIGLWYVAGGTRWYDLSNDVLWRNNEKLDLKKYLSQFDFVAEHGFMSEAVSINTPRANMATWYEDGILNLRYFYIGGNESISHVLFSTQPGSLQGYVYHEGVLRKFEAGNGDALAVAAFCPMKLTVDVPYQKIVMPNGAERAFLMMVADDKTRDRLVGEGCTIKESVSGTLTSVDIAKIIPLADYRRNRMDFDLMRSSVRQRIEQTN